MHYEKPFMLSSPKHSLSHLSTLLSFLVVPLLASAQDKIGIGYGGGDSTAPMWIIQNPGQL